MALRKPLEGLWSGTLAALLFAGCGGASPSPPETPTPELAGGFGAVGGGPSTGKAGSVTSRELGVRGAINGRSLSLRSAFLLTPDVEGPMELHAFEAEVNANDVCPAGLVADPEGVALQVVLPDLRHSTDASDARLSQNGENTPVRAASVDVVGSLSGGRTALVTVHLEGADGSRLDGVMPALVCVDLREAE